MWLHRKGRRKKLIYRMAMRQELGRRAEQVGWVVEPG